MMVMMTTLTTLTLFRTLSSIAAASVFKRSCASEAKFVACKSLATTTGPFEAAASLVAFTSASSHPDHE